MKRLIGIVLVSLIVGFVGCTKKEKSVLKTPPSEFEISIGQLQKPGFQCEHARVELTKLCGGNADNCKIADTKSFGKILNLADSLAQIGPKEKELREVYADNPKPAARDAVAGLILFSSSTCKANVLNKILHTLTQAPKTAVDKLGLKRLAVNITDQWYQMPTTHLQATLWASVLDSVARTLGTGQDKLQELGTIKAEASTGHMQLTTRWTEAIKGPSAQITTDIESTKAATTLTVDGVLKENEINLDEVPKVMRDELAQANQLEAKLLNWAKTNL